MGWSDPPAGTGPTLRPSVQETILYGNFATDAAALAGAPTPQQVTYDSAGGFWLAPPGWGTIATNPAAGEERYSVQAVAGFIQGRYITTYISAVVQQTNNGRGVQYSADGISNWNSTVRTTGYFRVWLSAGDIWGPPGLLSATASSATITNRLLLNFAQSDAFIPLDAGGNFTRGLYFAYQFTYGRSSQARGQAVVLAENIRSIARAGIHNRAPSLTNISNLFVAGSTMQLIFTPQFGLAFAVPAVRQGVVAGISSTFLNFYHETANPGVVTRARQFAPQGNSQNVLSINGLSLAA